MSERSTAGRRRRNPANGVRSADRLRPSSGMREAGPEALRVPGGPGEQGTGPGIARAGSELARRRGGGDGLRVAYRSTVTVWFPRASQSVKVPVAPERTATVTPQIFAAALIGTVTATSLSLATFSMLTLTRPC